MERLDIYYIGYNDKKPDWKANSVNPLSLINNRVNGYVSEKNGNKFLTIDKGYAVLKKFGQVFSAIKCHIGKASDEEVN